LYRSGAPDTIRTCDLCLRRDNAAGRYGLDPSIRRDTVGKLSQHADDEITQKLREAGYGHAFADGFIDMHGIALAAGVVLLAVMPVAQRERPSVRKLGSKRTAPTASKI
jgi:hypothetical protein